MLRVYVCVSVCVLCKVIINVSVEEVLTQHLASLKLQS